MKKASVYFYEKRCIGMREVKLDDNASDDDAIAKAEIRLDKIDQDAYDAAEVEWEDEDEDEGEWA